MIMKSTTVFCFVMLLVFVAISAEAKKNHTKHRNSTKWKEHKKKLNLGFLNEDKEINA